jgi:RNA polymerase sigma-70 factor (ECF subfamily)
MTAIDFHHQLLKLKLPLEKFAYRLTLKKSDVKDLVQETFLKVLINQDKFVNNDNFKAWTFTIMKNTFINNYRRGFRKNMFCDQTKESFFINHTVYAASEDPDSAYSVSEMTENIELLNDNLRIPFKMFIHGYKYKEIADELNLNIGTVKSRIYLSRRQLMVQLNA